MTVNGAASLKVVEPGEGREGRLAGIGVVFKLFSEDTGGQVAIVEHPFPVGAIVPPHIHTREDEFSIVTAGKIGFRSGDDEVVLGSGGYIVKPRNEVHTMWNAGSEPARMIEVIAPGGFEHFFWELSDLLEEEAPRMEELPRIAERHGLIMAEAEWLPDVIARYGLPRPAFLPPE